MMYLVGNGIRIRYRNGFQGLDIGMESGLDIGRRSGKTTFRGDSLSTWIYTTEEIGDENVE